MVAYPVDELKCLPDEIAFGHATQYRAYLKLMEDLHWSFNPKILQDLKGNIFWSPSVQNKGDQANHTQNVSVPDTTTKNTKTF